jgi:hypothetical protein
MNQKANLRDPQSLDNLSDALVRFALGATEALEMYDAKATSCRNWAQSRVSFWQSQVQYTRQALQIAQTALEQCIQSERTAHVHSRRPPDCRDLQQKVWKASQVLQENEYNYKRARHGLVSLDLAIGEYRIQAARLRDLIITQTPRARAFLDARRAEAERYLDLRIHTNSASDPPILEELAQVFTFWIPVVGPETTIKAGIGILNRLIVYLKIKMGEEGENANLEAASETFGLQAIHLDVAHQGFEGLLRSPSQPVIVLECKTSISDHPFQEHLEVMDSGDQ